MVLGLLFLTGVRAVAVEFVVAVRNGSGHIEYLFSGNKDSPIQIIDNIPHVLVTGSDYRLHNYTAQVPLNEKPLRIFNPHGFGVLLDCGGATDHADRTPADTTTTTTTATTTSTTGASASFPPGEADACSFSNNFPAMQFTFAEFRKGALYFAAHDVEATMKSIEGSSSCLRISGPLEARKIPQNKLFPVVGFPIIAEIVEGDYYDVAMRYKSFIFSAYPAWIAKPLADGPLDEVQLWINTHWQEYDVFEPSGGFPDSVFIRMEQLLSLLSLAPEELALHWYEWDTLGFPVEEDYQGTCDNEIRCGFDSHYPQYFPARRNFDSVVAQLSHIGVKIFPYINGRIFDTNIPAWNEAAARAAAKDESGNLYIENYGNGVDFAAMCPSTGLWRNVLNEVVRNLTSEFAISGVYIDQVACASPVPCYDSTHDHPPGGGSHWTEDYRQIMEEIRKSNTLCVTESNVEQFIGSFDGFLTLQAFWDESPHSHVVPVFQTIYGGFIRTFGSIFHKGDLDSDLFREKLALQFIFGAQLGWFSLVGAADNAGFPSVGLLDALLDQKNKLNVDFLKKLITERRKLSRLFSAAHAGRRLGKFSQIWILEEQYVTVSVNPYDRVMLIEDAAIPPLEVLVNFQKHLNDLSKVELVVL